MSKPTYEDLVDILKKVWTTTKIEFVLDTEWANYPAEVFDEITDVIMELELEENE